MQVVAVKLMHKNGSRHRQFIVEALMLSHLDHPNLVNLIGYCPDSDRQLLVYEYMPLGSLEDHLHGNFFGYSGLHSLLSKCYDFERQMWKLKNQL